MRDNMMLLRVLFVLILSGLLWSCSSSQEEQDSASGESGTEVAEQDLEDDEEDLDDELGDDLDDEEDLDESDEDVAFDADLQDSDLEIDDMLGSISDGANGGTAYGLFENSEEMALNLGFSGFRRGSYDFYKTDWKYLNDASTRGATAVSGIEGVLIPAGTSTVYDQILGTNIRRPFLHVRYRASQADDRRMKSWITGSVGGAYTSALDAMQVHFLSERCLVTQGANNFVLFTASNP